jgi:hypothetical protein
MSMQLIGCVSGRLQNSYALLPLHGSGPSAASCYDKRRLKCTLLVLVISCLETRASSHLAACVRPQQLVTLN